MGLHWSPERRIRLEKIFLRKNHEILQKSGIIDYSWKECYNDYRSAIIFNLYTIVWWWSTKNIPASVWWYHSEGVLSAFEDLNCNELLKLK